MQTSASYLYLQSVLLIYNSQSFEPTMKKDYIETFYFEANVFNENWSKSIKLKISLTYSLVFFFYEMPIQCINWQLVMVPEFRRLPLQRIRLSTATGSGNWIPQVYN